MQFFFSFRQKTFTSALKKKICGISLNILWFILHLTFAFLQSLSLTHLYIFMHLTGWLKNSKLAIIEFLFSVQVYININFNVSLYDRSVTRPIQRETKKKATKYFRFWTPIINLGKGKIYNNISNKIFFYNCPNTNAAEIWRRKKKCRIFWCLVSILMFLDFVDPMSLVMSRGIQWFVSISSVI